VIAGILRCCAEPAFRTVATVKLRKLRFHPLRLGQRLTLRPPGTSRHLVFGQASANP